jgi:hypothetical protein
MPTRSSSLLDSPRSIGESQSVKNSRVAVTGDSRLTALMKSLYQTDQQVKYLHLQAEVESLLHQQKFLKQQRLASDHTETAN